VIIKSTLKHKNNGYLTLMSRWLQSLFN